MNPIKNNIRFAILAAGALLASAPSWAGPAHKDTAKTAKPAGQKDGHDHDHADHDGHGGKEGGQGHEGHDHGHEGKEKAAVGTGRTDIKAISAALRENLACIEKELAATEHTSLHGCLEAIESLGVDLISLKVPADPAKKKRVDGYAKNLGQMAHQVDEYVDAKKTDKAKAQLKKLASQVGMIESQFEEFAKKPAGK